MHDGETSVGREVEILGNELLEKKELLSGSRIERAASREFLSSEPEEFKLEFVVINDDVSSDVCIVDVEIVEEVVVVAVVVTVANAAVPVDSGT